MASTTLQHSVPALVHLCTVAAAAGWAASSMLLRWSRMAAYRLAAAGPAPRSGRWLPTMWCQLRRLPGPPQCTRCPAPPPARHLLLLRRCIHTFRLSSVPKPSMHPRLQCGLFAHLAHLCGAAQQTHHYYICQSATLALLRLSNTHSSNISDPVTHSARNI